MKFVGRKPELELLQREYCAKRGAFVPVYGRRRVGKSQLIVEFTRDKPTLYFTALQSSNVQNLHSFGKLAAKTTGLNSLAGASNWEDLLQDTVAAWKAPRRRVLVIDEIQWLVGGAKEIPSLIQRLWDHDWQPRADLMIILCGSHFGFFQDHILRAGSPLYGRRTNHIHLAPLDLQEVAAFHPGLAEEDLAQIYFITGGIPYYLQKFESDSIPVNILRNFLRPQADLATEADFLLHEETNQVSTAKAILSAIAEGYQRYGEIAANTGIATTNLPYYLEPLERIGFIEKRVPLSRGPASRNLVRYGIMDPFLRFWFQFFFPPYGAEAFKNPEGLFHDAIRPRLDAYWGGCWERLCREQLPRIYAREGVACHARIGEFWTPREVQIDVVSLRADKRTDLGECRWSRVRSLAALARELEQKIPAFPNPGKESVGRCLFVRSCQGNKPEGYRVHTLHDLFSL
jgi:AAA+ ATPase superfamily predicted ATPase